jgi:chemotaxis protein MotB
MSDIQIPTRENPLDLLPPPRPPSRVPWVVAAVSLIGAAAVAGTLYRMTSDARGEVERVKRDAAETAQKLRDAQQERDTLGTQVKALETQKSTLQSEVEKKEKELARMKAAQDALQDKMRAEIQKGDIRLTDNGGRLQVELVDKVLFDSGQADLSKRGEEVLLRLGAVLAKIDERQFQVAGHTDDSPPTEKIKAQFPTNWELSAARAVNVVRFLAEKGGVPPKRLVASGHSEFQPVATNANPAGRARNRRIEILLTPTLEAKAGAVAKDAAAARKK